MLAYLGERFHWSADALLDMPLTEVEWWLESLAEIERGTRGH